MEKHFRAIEGYPGYRVSRDGVVESCWLKAGRHSRLTDSWKPLKPIRLPLGYRSVNLHADGRKVTRKVHQLVLEAFIGPRPPGMVCCHWDGDPGNNRLENLRWDTQKGNADDTLRHGRRRFGEEAGSKLRSEEVIEIRRQWAEGRSINKLAAAYGVSTPAISNIVHRRSWTRLA